MNGDAHLHSLEDALGALRGRLPDVESWGTRLAARLLAGGRLLAAGNGGSAAHAQHLTAELVGRYRDERVPLSAISLHADTSSFTAIVNDYGAEQGFARQGTIRSYSYTDDELQAAISGQLDVISGFMIIDDDMRLVVVEGLAAPGCGMESLFIDLPRAKPNDDSLKILCNPEVLFPNRLYATFGPDLRRIRIRDKLKKLVRRPEIYNRKQVEELCFEAIDGIMALKRAPDLRATKELDLYPSAESLNKLELLYGEAISRADMDGTLKEEYVKNAQGHSPRTSPRAGCLAGGGSPLVTETAAGADASQQAATGGGRTGYEFTDCRNPAFEEYLRSRPAHRIDFLAENRTLRQAAWANMLQRTAARDAQLTATLRRVLGVGGDDGDTRAAEKSANGRGGSRSAAAARFDEDSLATDGDSDMRESNGGGGRSSAAFSTKNKEPKIYMYSQQALNFKEKAFAELRGRIGDDRNATYTYSQDFVSQTICVVDEETEKKWSAAASKEAWLTAKGFQYPKRRTREELIRHPNRPSEIRCEELHTPFTDGTDVKVSAGDTVDPALRSLEKNFTTRFKGTELFGALKPPQYEREFQLKLVGDRTALPRGLLLPVSEEPDPDAFKSVHLIGEAKAKIMAEAEAAEKAAWAAKVKVDHLDFKMSGYKIRDKPIPMDRASDILKSAPQKAALIALRTMTSAGGKDFSYATAPLSIMNAEPYVQNQAMKALQREEDRTKFITATLAAGEERPKDFVRYINNDAANAKVLSVLAKKKHPPQDRNSAECSGPKWDAAAAAPAGGDSGNSYAHK